MFARALWFCTLYALAWFPSTLPAAAPMAPTASYEVGLRAPQVWRGITIRDFPILTLSAEVAHRSGWTANLWAGADLSDTDGRRGEIQEIDLELSRLWETERTLFTAGYTGYFFPAGGESTGELYGRARWKGWLSPTLTLFYNHDLLKDLFATFSLERGWPLGESTELNWQSTVAYSGRDYATLFGGTRAGFHHHATRLRLIHSRPTRRPLRPTLYVRVGLADTLDRQVLPRQPRNLWTSVSVGWTTK